MRRPMAEIRGSPRSTTRSRRGDGALADSSLRRSARRARAISTARSSGTRGCGLRFTVTKDEANERSPRAHRDVRSIATSCARASTSSKSRPRTRRRHSHRARRRTVTILVRVAHLSKGTHAAFGTNAEKDVDGVGALTNVFRSAGMSCAAHRPRGERQRARRTSGRATPTADAARRAAKADGRWSPASPSVTFVPVRGNRARRRWSPRT